MSITSEQLKAILADQQAQFMKLLQNIQIGNAPPQQNPSQSNDMDLFCKLSAQISEFVYSPDDNRTFEEWYERFGPFVEQEGKPMSEQSKVRLIVSKLGTDEYKRYTESIQPQTPDKVGLLDTISKLRTIFPETKSIFIKRYECFRLKCEVNQDVLAFGSTVNAMAEKAKLDLTKDQIKSLIFITGLGEHNAELRHRCLKLLDGNANYEQLLTECKEVIALRQSSAALSGRHDFNAIQIRPSKIQDRPKNKPTFRARSLSQPRQHNTHSANHSTVQHSTKPMPTEPCYRCGGRHWNSDCPYPKSVKCHKCGRLGHISTICRTKGKQQTNFGKTTNIVECLNVTPAGFEKEPNIIVYVQFGTKWIPLVADTGSKLTILRMETWRKLGMPKLSNTNLLGRSYTGDIFNFTGKCTIKAALNGEKGIYLDFYVVEKGSFDLLGLAWIRAFEQAYNKPVATTLKFDQPTHSVQIKGTECTPTQLKAELQAQFPNVFSDGLGMCTKFEAHLKLKENSSPVFCGSRPVPLGVQNEVDAELDRMIELGVLQKVDYSKWAAPIVAWDWTEKHQQAFEKAKQILLSDLALTHFDPNLQIIVTADASNSGIGATISHRFPDGKEKVFHHAARTLTKTEQAYSQIEKEGLGLIFAIQKFHQFIFGRKFILRTDHRPLLGIFGSKNGIPIFSASRLQRWALTLLNYDFSLEFVRTDNTGQADALSRLITEQRGSSTEEDIVIAQLCAEANADVEHVFNAQVDQLPITVEEIKSAQQEDELIKEVIKFTQTKWPNQGINAEMKPYFSGRHNFSLITGCLVFNGRSVIPPSLRSRTLKALHLAHPGIVRMKNLARSFVYWPSMDTDIETIVRGCSQCQQAAKQSPKQPLQPWPTTTSVFERIHIDLAGPCSDGNIYLVIIDTFSKWPEVFFSVKHRPRPSLTNFNGYLIVLSNRSPAELFLGRKLRTHISLMRPDRGQTRTGENNANAHKMKAQFDRKHGAKSVEFKIGEQVQFVNYQNAHKIITRHANAVRLSAANGTDHEWSTDEVIRPLQPHVPAPVHSPVRSPQGQKQNTPSPNHRMQPQERTDQMDQHQETEEQTPELRRSKRTTKKVRFLSPRPTGQRHEIRDRD
ncbi:hypothetical protein niasHT_033892 [Heterodera trifolii]|uniref:RNA-directed DNA polymerase n=1 Tax=Heterodera trifolii TaxID=157864 RepID=A0ABD2HWW8_9BILA